MHRKVLLLLLIVILTVGFSTISHGRNPSTVQKVIELSNMDEFIASTTGNRILRTLDKIYVISGRARQHTQVVFEVYSVTTEVNEFGIQSDIETKRSSKSIVVNNEAGIFAEEVEIFKGLNKIVIKAIDRDKNSNTIERFVILSDANDAKNLPTRLIIGESLVRPNNNQEATDKNELKK